MPKQYEIMIFVRRLKTSLEPLFCPHSSPLSIGSPARESTAKLRDNNGASNNLD